MCRHSQTHCPCRCKLEKDGGGGWGGLAWKTLIQQTEEKPGRLLISRCLSVFLCFCLPPQCFTMLLSERLYINTWQRHLAQRDRLRISRNRTQFWIFRRIFSCSLLDGDFLLEHMFCFYFTHHHNLSTEILLSSHVLSPLCGFIDDTTSSSLDSCATAAEVKTLHLKWY